MQNIQPGPDGLCWCATCTSPAAAVRADLAATFAHMGTERRKRLLDACDKLEAAADNMAEALGLELKP